MNFTDRNPVYSRITSIDFRHALMLRAVVDVMKPAHVLEIGSYRGGSTMAFLSAMNAGNVQRISLCDKTPTMDLAVLCKPYDPERVGIYACDSNNKTVRALAPDLAFIDGDHRAQGLEDIMHQRDIHTPIIAIHDVFTVGEVACPPWAWGSVSGATRLREPGSGYPFILLDNKPRKGERTERGLMVAFRETPANERELVSLWNTLAG